MLFSISTESVAYLQTEPSENLEAPTLTATYTGTNTVELSWSEVTGADHYNLLMWRNINSGWEPIGADKYEDRTYIDDTFTANRPERYYIVAAVDANGVIGQWSNQVKVPAFERLPAPTLTLGETATTSIGLIWTEVSGADSYELWAWWEPEPEWQQVEANLQGTSYSHRGLTVGRTYHYLIRAVNAAGVAGPWSDQLVATLQDAPTPTQSPSPSPTSTPSSGPTSTPTPTQTAAPSPTPTSTPTPGPTQTPSPTPTAAGMLPAPTLMATLAGTNTVALSWSEVTGADHYDLRQWLNSGTGWESIPTDRYTGRAYTDDTLTVGAPVRYYIVAAVNASGEIGQWSNRVQVPASNELISPTLTLSAIVTTTIELSWTDVPGADRYEMLAWWDAVPDWQSIETNLRDTSYSHRGLTLGKTYHYLVRAVDTNGAGGPWSNQLLAMVPTTSQTREAEERAALIALYDATDGPNWTLSDNWLTNEPLSNWYGVSTNSDGRVTELHLSSNELKGAMPDLTPLANLTTLSLSSNMLSGTVPDLSALVSLTVLDLSFNRFSGSVPDLDDLANLEWLSLNNNEFAGSIPDLSNLSSLLVLELGENNLTGSIPDLSALTNLTSLSLGSNQFSGSVPDLSALVNLEELYLTDSNLSGPFPDVSTLTNLTELFLGTNQLTGSIPDISGLTKLTWLDLSNNMLDGQVPDLSALTELTWISLGRNQLTGQIPNLSPLLNLRALNMGHNLLTGPVPDFSALTKLKLLVLSGNDLCLPAGLDPSSSTAEVAAHLTELSLPSCPNAFLTDAGFGSFVLAVRNQLFHDAAGTP